MRLGPCVLLLVGCRTSMPSGFDVDAAAAFQAEAEQHIVAPTSPLSVVDSFYLGPGESTWLVRDGRRVRASHDEAAHGVQLAVADTFECRFGCGAHEGAITSSVTVPMPPLTLGLAPQPVGERPGGRALAHDPEAPGLKQHTALHWFPVTEALIVAAKFEAAADPQPVELTTSRGLAKRFVAAGVLHFELGGAAQSLTAFRSVGAPPSTPMLVPFTDRTTGASTYPVGRYVEATADGKAAVIDFNRATNPWCAYSEHFNCPVPPKDNRIDLAIEAGEKSYTHR